MCSDPLEAHENYLTQGSGISDFLQLRNAGLVIAAASVAAANPIAYRLGLFCVNDNIFEGEWLEPSPPQKNNGKRLAGGGLTIYIYIYMCKFQRPLFSFRDTHECILDLFSQDGGMAYLQTHPQGLTLRCGLY